MLISMTWFTELLIYQKFLFSKNKKRISQIKFINLSFSLLRLITIRVNTLMMKPLNNLIISIINFIWRTLSLTGLWIESKECTNWLRQISFLNDKKTISCNQKWLFSTLKYKTCRILAQEFWRCLLVGSWRMTPCRRGDTVVLIQTLNLITTKWITERAQFMQQMGSFLLITFLWTGTSNPWWSLCSKYSGFALTDTTLQNP